MKTIHLLFALLLSLTLFSQTVNVDLNAEYQTIRGFGGINHPEWYSDLNASERALAFGNEDGQLGFTVLRTYVSDNSANWSLGLQTAKYAYDNGATVFASPWNPPAAMTWDEAGQKRINTAFFADYANHLNDYVTHMRTNGVELYAISTQNEPDYAENWTEWTPQESVDFIKGYANLINCRLITPESFQYRKTIYDPILADPAALANVDIFGTHLYGTQYKDFPYSNFQQNGTGKELWMTEVYTDSKYDANIWSDTYINDDRHAIKLAEHIHYAMVEGQFQTYVFWPLRRYYALIHDGNSDGNGNTPAAAGSATKRGYCMAQFSKWVRPGYVRIGATSSPSPNVFVSAYKDGSDVVIVVVNKNTTTQALTMNIPGTQVTSWEQYTTSASKNIQKGTTIAGGGNFNTTLDAASVTTFVGVANPGSPEILFSSPSEGTCFTAPATVPIDVQVSDADGTIAHIDFYINDEVTTFHEEWTAPYAFDWTNVEAGTYSVKAIVYDNDNNTSEDVITINVQGAYNGVAHAIPGVIQLEEFDKGGNGCAYYDSSPGTSVPTPPNFRTDEDVDIESCSDTGAGYNIGYAIAGEWLEYTVNVEEAGLYNIVLRAACDGDGRAISLYMNDVELVTDVEIANTGGWQTWSDVTVNNVELSAGEQVLKVLIGNTDYVNLNYISFSKVSETTSIQLYKGWNLIGFPLTEETPVEIALSSIWDKVISVKDADGFYLNSQPAVFNSLTSLFWGRGYLVKVSEDCILEF